MRRALVCGDASLMLVASRRCDVFRSRCHCIVLPPALSVSPWTATVRCLGAARAATFPPCSSPSLNASTAQDVDHGDEEGRYEFTSSEEEGSEEETGDDEFEGAEDDEGTEAGDGGDGGGVVLGGAPWAAKALEIARNMLTPEFALYAFKVCSTGFIQLRLDKLTDRFGSPTIEEVEEFSNEYRALLEEAGRTGLVPSNVAIEVSSPGAERVVQIPGDLDRFNELPMQVLYYTEASGEQLQILQLESLDRASLSSVWRLANLRVNRGKGRSALSRKQREWRLKLPWVSIKLVRLHVDTFAGGDDEQE